ncbi:hypothetical protein U1Q18_026038 [Sarracenia purpurea var. burkii]
MTTLHQILSSRSSSDASTHGRRRCVESFIGRIWPLSGDPNQATVSEHGDPTDNSPAHRHRQRTPAPPLAAPARLRRAYITPLLRTAEVTASDLRLQRRFRLCIQRRSACTAAAAPVLHRSNAAPLHRSATARRALRHQGKTSGRRLQHGASAVAHLRCAAPARPVFCPTCLCASYRRSP